MAAALVPIVDVSASSSSSDSKGLRLESIKHIGQALIIASSVNYDATLSWVQAHARDVVVSVDITALSSVDQAIELLNAGVTRVVASPEQIEQLRSSVDESRLVLAAGSTFAESAPRGGVFVEFNGTVISSLKNAGNTPTYVLFGSTPTLENIKAVSAASATPVIPASSLTVDGASDSGLLSVSDIFLAGVSSDRPDGLLTTLVVDESEVALGLVYSSPESVAESLRTGRGVYQSRKRGLWRKGETSGAIQELLRVDFDCDRDCLRFVVHQKGTGFCHLETATCFGGYRGLRKLESTLLDRKANAVEGSYTARLFSDEKLLRAKIMEEAEELVNAKTKEEVAFEAADLLYFALTKCVAAGVSLEDVERNLDAKSLKVTRRKGDAKGQWAAKEGIKTEEKTDKTVVVKAAPVPEASAAAVSKESEPILMQRFEADKATDEELEAVLRRPAQKTNDIMGIVTPIIEDVRTNGDAAILKYAAKFDRATGLKSAVLKAPFPAELMQLSQATIDAIDLSFENIRKFHAGQKEDSDLVVETMPGVKCSRFVRPIERVGLYIPGGTAVLPSTALMLGVPAMVAGCNTLVFATPPRPDGSITPEIVYVAHKVGAHSIVLAGGAQAVAALAYGTESVPKVDKILGPGNQFVTAAKMFVSNDTRAAVAIDMPAGPSEVLVVADAAANPAFVASDLLSQAEHGVDSQVVLIAVDLNDEQLGAIEKELETQALALPRVDIVRGSIAHSVTLRTKTLQHALELSNAYAPEHLILQVANARDCLPHIINAGSVFIGAWTPESVGDYSAGVNHSLPTYGYAKQYSGVNLGTYVKHITASELTEEGLRNVGGAVMELARVEALEAHRRAVEVRLQWADAQKA